MVNKTIQSINITDQTKYLEQKLQQDLIAYKKVLKWARSIEIRIEKTQLQLENEIKSSSNPTVVRKQVKTCSKIPVRPVHQTYFSKQETSYSNLFDKPISKHTDEANRVNLKQGKTEKTQVEKPTSSSEQIFNNFKRFARTETPTAGTNNEYTQMEIVKIVNQMIKETMEHRITHLEKISVEIGVKSNSNSIEIETTKKSVYAINQGVKNIEEEVNEFKNQIDGLENQVCNTNWEMENGLKSTQELITKLFRPSIT